MKYTDGNVRFKYLQLWSHCLNRDIELIHPIRKFPLAPFWLFPCLLLPKLLFLFLSLQISFICIWTSFKWNRVVFFCNLLLWVNIILLWFLHVAANISSSFIAEYYSIVEIHYSLSDDLLLNIMSSFQFGAIMSTVAVNICVQVFLGSCVFPSLGLIPRSEIVGP